MAIGRLLLPQEEANDQPYAADVNFWVGPDKTTPLAIASAEGWIRRRGETATPPLALTTANARLTIFGGRVMVRVSEPDVGTLPPGSYEAEVKVADENGGERQVRWFITLRAGLGS